MPRPASLSRSDLLAKLSGVFRTYGFDGATMQDLSAASGLSKASLYHHFPGGKEEMAEKVLGEEGIRLQQLVLAPLKGEHPLDSLIASLHGVAAFYSGDKPQCMMNSITLGSGKELFAKNVAVAVQAWRAQWAHAYRNVGATDAEAQSWADYAVERIQGALVVCRVQNSRTSLDRCLEELEGDARFAADAG